MAITKHTDLGRITINDMVIAKAVIKATEEMKNRFFLSTEKGKIIGTPTRVSVGDLNGHFKTEVKDGAYIVTIYGIISFGSSIKNVTETIFDILEQEMKDMFPDHGGSLIIKIVGVKSRNIAERDIEVKRDYEASGKGFGN